MTRVTVAAIVLVCIASARAGAQEVTLQKNCEVGFRALIRDAQSGRLGADVTNANVRVQGKLVEVELVRANAASLLFRLTPKASEQVYARYFDIAFGVGATAADAERLGRGLNAAFDADPFVIVVSEGGRVDDPIPAVAAAWRYGGWQGVARVIERRMMVLAGVRYTVAMVVFLALGISGCVALFWLSPAPLRR